MTYDQITQDERDQIAALRALGYRGAAIARQLRRHRSTIMRELRRNRTARGPYVAYAANARAVARRRHSRRNQRVRPQDWARVCRLLSRRWSPEQIAGRLAHEGTAPMSRATIYRRLHHEQRAGGTLWRRLCRSHRRQPSRGRPPRASRLGRPLNARPGVVEAREQIGHWEIDTVLGRGSQACIVTMVERATNFVAIGAMAARNATAFADCTLALIARQRRRVRTITADNGTEVTGYRRIERLTGSRFYFAAPDRSWERAINENMNGLIREYLPKGRSLAGLTQHECNRIARELNQRPRKRLGFRTPEECYGTS